MAKKVYPEEYLEYWERLLEKTKRRSERRERWGLDGSYSLNQEEEYQKWLKTKQFEARWDQSNEVLKGTLPEYSGNKKVDDWFNNALTGDRDFSRQVALQQMQQDFNSAEAALAHKRQVNIAQNSTLWQAEQLKQLGVNPAWAIAGGGGSTPAITTAPTATSQVGNASPSGAQFGNSMNLLGQLVMTAARLAIQKNQPYLKGVFIQKK